MGDIFEETARNEKEHAKIWFKLLHGNTIPSTEENLKDAAAGENYEWTDMYAIEKHHEERYRKLLKNIEDKIVFSREGDAVWQCANCGHIVVGKAAPEVCPVCAHPKSYFQLLAENY